MKEKIRLSGVPETMLQTVYARAKESRGRGAIHDAKAEEIIEKLDYDFSRRHCPNHRARPDDEGMACVAPRRGGGQHRLRAGYPLLPDVGLRTLV